VALGGGPADKPSTFPAALTPNGAIVAFDTEASNIVAGDTNGQSDVFVRDVAAGTTTRISLSSAGAQGNSYSRSASLSADARFVAFMSLATTLVPADLNGTEDVFLHDRLTGVTTLVSVASDGTHGNSWSSRPSISADGRRIGFHSWSNNLVVGDTNNFQDIFVRDVVLPTTRRVSVDSAGLQADHHSYELDVSADGRFVAFQSDGKNLVPGDTNGNYDIFVHDYLGAPPTLTLKVNGADSVLLTYPAPLTLSATLDPGDHAGEVCDWWVVGASAVGDFWFKPFLWQLSGTPVLAYQGPLFAFGDLPLYSAPIPPFVPQIAFTWYLDDNPDGILAPTWSDTATVFLQ
jgi:hypothetical protein